MALMGFGPVVAMGHKGARVEAAVGPNAGPTLDWRDKAARDRALLALENVSKLVQRHIQGMISAGTVTTDQARAQHMHVFTLVLDHYGIIRAEGNSAQIAEQEGFNVTEIIASIDTDVRGRLRRGGFNVPEGGNRRQDSGDRRSGEGRGAASGGPGVSGTPAQDQEGGDGKRRVPAAPRQVERGKPVRIEDAGEKIGGARKDTAVSTGPRGSRSASDTPGWRKRYSVIQNWDLRATGADKDKFMILDTRTNKGVRDGYRTKLFDTQEEAEAAVPLYEVARNHRVVSQGDKFAIVRVVSDRKRPVIKDGFATREEAQEHMARNAVEIIETKTRIDDSIHPALEQAIRKGEERRDGGRDVGSDDFADVFGFRGVEFGNWNNNAERQHIVNQAFDAMLDLAEILKVPPKALSLNGDLALAFGARGHGLTGARAHYERNYGVINLTKIQGAGALAHEWWHAVDHYFARQDGKASSEKVKNDRGDLVFKANRDASKDYASHSVRYKSGLRDEVQDAIRKLVKAVYERRQEFTEDVSTREKIEDRAGVRLDRVLDQFRNELATEQRYGRKRAPATEAQLKNVDALFEKIRNGDLGEKVEAPSKAQFHGHFFNEPVLRLAEIFKDVRGRQAYGHQQNRNTGPAHKIQSAIDAKAQADKFLADAKEQRVKEKTVRTEYASEAWKLDQGSKSDYWSTNHEMTARAFESYVYDRLQDIDARNDFLAYEKHNNLPKYQLFRVKPYPEGKERDTINQAFRDLFDTLKTRETAQGVAFYETDPNDKATGDLFAEPVEPRSGMTQRQRLEMEARMRQSKMRRLGGNSGDAGPLFDTQSDLLDGMSEDGRDVFAADFLANLAANDDIFQYPKATSRTIEGVFSEIAPDVRYGGKKTPADITADEPDVGRHVLYVST